VEKIPKISSSPQWKARFESWCSIVGVAGTSFALTLGQQHLIAVRSDSCGRPFQVLFFLELRELHEMGNRRNTLLWMKDLIEHMNQCHEQLQWAGDGPTESFLTESLLVDLAQCQRLCEELRERPRKSRMLAVTS